MDSHLYIYKVTLWLQQVYYVKYETFLIEWKTFDLRIGRVHIYISVKKRVSPPDPGTFLQSQSPVSGPIEPSNNWSFVLTATNHWEHLHSETF